jgi:hypothetical protein
VFKIHKVYLLPPVPRLFRVFTFLLMSLLLHSSTAFLALSLFLPARHFGELLLVFDPIITSFIYFDEIKSHFIAPLNFLYVTINSMKELNK